LILTPAVAGVFYAIVGFATSRAVSPDYRTPPIADFIVGCVTALAFEILVLLPLAWVIAKVSRSRAVLLLLGSGIWFFLSLALFAIFYVGWDAVIVTSLQMLIPGVALNAVFTFLFAETAHA